jgi:hypothetical protein
MSEKEFCFATHRITTPRATPPRDASPRPATQRNVLTKEDDTMKRVTFLITGLAPYSQSKNYPKVKNQGESDDDHYRRTWREHMHVNGSGTVFIPPTGIKNTISEAAKFLSIPIPGKGKSLYTKHFEAGILVSKPVDLGVRAEDVEYERLFLPSDGKRGGGKRVWKYYPFIPKWQGEVELVVIDDTVLQSSVSDPTKTVLEVVLDGAGSYKGLGRFRPANNGFYGRFEVSDFKVEEM